MSKIRKCKQETWQQFVEVEGNRDPWGIVYKIVREKFGKLTLWTALRLPDGSKTTCLDGTIEALLRKCVPEDNATEMSEENLALKQSVEGYTNMNLEPMISFNEIKLALSKLKNRKAPGADNFKIQIVRELWKEMPEAIIGLINNCFIQRIFPRPWKEANLKILLKDENRNRTLLSSYRPITLFSVVGKIFEKIIVERINETYKEAGLESPDQFGFKKGKGTDDAFLSLRQVIKFTDKKYVITIFVDIEGAFDNLWLPAILARLVRAKCKSYCSQKLFQKQKGDCAKQDENICQKNAERKSAGLNYRTCGMSIVYGRCSERPKGERSTRMC